ncbi:alcohol dehydrogenase catalytic domain-containing protein [Jannaschia sp. Os4]|uniref:alcohol dehydrogenase catalytic domain-containing protein n=1 Tax=Jannaschia sp. Os4 TaxID=2807617 RepID=UPI001939D32E|nr:alcohol dehydrogenase catalytic domain-containing protein [Jannaschia sp. Os4]MBM2575975.1 alcohol dehydrogenase catalytic domain-containing protein [Jannaschia sp. Os4]
MRTIRAAVCRAHGEPLALEEVLLPDPARDEVQVDLEAVAICHSDVTYADGGWGGALPAVYGHEAVGRVAAVGDGVGDLEPGARVLVTLIRACGTCAACASGRPTQCATPGDHPGLTNADGEVIAAAMACGAFAEAVTVHRSQVAQVGEEVAAPGAACLSCGVVTGLGAAVNTARVRPGDWCVVVGCGGVGLNAVQGARLAGAARIVAVDLTEEKLEAAKAFGATDGVLVSEGPEGLKRLGRLADHAFVTVGHPAAFDAAPGWLAPHGTAYLVGLPHVGTETRFDPVSMGFYGQGFRGTRMGDVVLRRDVPWLLDLHRQGRLKLEELVSATYPFERINDAMDAVRRAEGRRNVVVF